jgi:3-hydroxyisobutyrate dehydrogenase-like beta-hydroxyacid dehydrogenase
LVKIGKAQDMTVEHADTQPFRRIAFVGLGVMGEPICRNLAAKSGIPVTGFDLDPAPMRRLVPHGVRQGASLDATIEDADAIFLSLPSGDAVGKLARSPEGLLAKARRGQIVIDLSTSAVDITRNLAKAFAEADALFVDAPVARTRAAAEAGTLSVMVGAEPDAFERVRPLLATFASDIARCGPVGCGQVVKILNNMLLFQIVTALAESKAIGERMGVDPSVLFDTLSNGSADSFALRNHGMKAILPDEFPERAFPISYALKDLSYGLRLATEAAIATPAAEHVKELFEQGIRAGYGNNYWPVISRLIKAA